MKKQSVAHRTSQVTRPEVFDVRRETWDVRLLLGNRDN
jgi:hypothetical protein